MTTFLMNPCFSCFPFFRVLYYIHCQGTALHYQYHFCTSIENGVRTYITNISNNITKQYYGTIKTFKILVIVKKKQFRTTNVFIQKRSITLNRQTFLDFKNLFMMPICQGGKLFKKWYIIAN